MIVRGGDTGAVDEHTSPSQAAGVPDMSSSYDAYISSGLYDRRYPRPNKRTLSKSLRCLRNGGRFLDFGAGTGRYTLPLMEMTRANGVAYDVCPEARRALAQRLRPFVGDGRLVIQGGDLAAMAGAYRRAFDLALLAFGVLGHVAGRSQRMRLLDAIREMTKPDGVLVLGVPNARRRLRAEQRSTAPLVGAGELEPGDVLYTRGRSADEIRMFYHLFSPAEARRDLAAAGFRVESVEPESLLPESMVVGNRWLGSLDALACRLAPASIGYGFLIVGRPMAADAR